MFKLGKYCKSLLSSLTTSLGHESSHSQQTGPTSQGNQRRDGTEFRGILNDLNYFVFVALAKPLSALHTALEAGPNLNHQLRNGLTPLHLAVAAMKSYTRSEYPAIPAVISKVLALLEAGASPNIASDKGSTPVHISAAFDTPEVLVLLHSKGGSITAKDIHGNTPLHIAVACRSTATVRTILALLSSSRANHRTSSDHASPRPIDAVNNRGETALLLALRLAAEWKWSRADVRDFADAHADQVPSQAPSSSPDKEDDLTTSRERKYLKYILIAEQLVSSGADTSLVNKDGMTARDLCAHLGLTVEGLYSGDETSCGEDGTTDREMNSDARDVEIDIRIGEEEIGDTADSHDVSAPLETPEPSFYSNTIHDTAAEPSILLPSMQEAVPLYLLAPPPPSLVRRSSLGGRSRSTHTDALAVQQQAEEALVQEAGPTATEDAATTVFVATDIPCNVLPATSFYSHLPGNDARHHSLSGPPSAVSNTPLSSFIAPPSTFTVPASTSTFTVPPGWAWSSLYSPSPPSASPPSASPPSASPPATSPRATSPRATSLPASLFLPDNGLQTNSHAHGGDAAGSQPCSLGEQANVLLSPKKISALTERLCPLTRAVLARDLHAVTDLLKDGADINGWYDAPRVSALHVPPVSRAVLLGKTGKGDGDSQAKTNVGKGPKSKTGLSKINGGPHDMVEEAKNDSKYPSSHTEKPHSDTHDAVTRDLLSFDSNSQPIQVARAPRYITHAPLLIACWLHATAIGCLLLRRGAAVNVVDAAGNTPLLLVCRHHSGEVGRISVSRCGEESDREMNDQTLFDGSVASAEPRSPSPCTETNTASLDLMLQLLFSGAAPNVTNTAGATPLSVCAENNDIARMRVLLAFGADPNSGITWSPYNQFSGKRERDIRLRAKSEGEQEGSNSAASGETAGYGSILAPAKVVNGSDVLNIHDKHVIVGPESPIPAKHPSPHPTESGINDNSTKSKRKPVPRLSLDPQAHIPLTSHPKFASHNALRWAVAWCNAEMVELLTRYGAHADICDERGKEGKLLSLVDAMMLADEAIVARGCGFKEEGGAGVMRDRTVTDASREDVEMAPSEPNARDDMMDSTLDCGGCREGTTDVRSVAQAAFNEREGFAARERMKKWPRIREMLLAARAVNDEEHYKKLCAIEARKLKRKREAEAKERLRPIGN